MHKFIISFLTRVEEPGLSDESKGLKDIDRRLLRNSIGNEGQAPPNHKQGPWAMVVGGSMCEVAQ